MKPKKRLVIIHIQPIELYPPIQNLLLVLNKSKSFNNITVISTCQNKLPEFSLNSKVIRIFRLNVASNTRFLRFLKYLFCVLYAILKLIQLRPKKVLYFESISAMPAIFYKSLFQSVELFVHYHEYTTPQEYFEGMKFIKYSNKIERNTYSKFVWISHTNSVRIKLFLSDNRNVSSNIIYCLPNYPSNKWCEPIKPVAVKVDFNPNILRFVYIGALSLDDTYIAEIINFVRNSPDKYDLELFSFHISEEIQQLINIDEPLNIRYSGVANYNDIPSILSEKQVGLILYKGNTLNYVYNAPNKLFEYLVCGLDVWFPKEMVGCFEYATDKNPKVVKIDFDHIEESIKNYSYSLGNRNNDGVYYTAEAATRELIAKLVN